MNYIQKLNIINKIKKSNISYIRLLFTDILGNIKGINYRVNKLNDLLSNYITFDGSSIKGFSKVDKSDLILKVDFDSLYILKLKEDNVAVFFCDIYNSNNKPHYGCTRSLLKRKLNNIYPYIFKIGFEIEFYLLDSNLNLIDNNTYLDILNNNKSDILIEKLVKTLEANELNIECYHHEVGPSQYEISLKYEDALNMCDKLQLFKLIINHFEIEENIKISLIPKIKENLPGSGLHLNCSIYENNINLFKSTKEINEFTKYFINGILLHSIETSLIYNQTFNSYKRLINNSEAPKKSTWSYSNRTSMIRIPRYNNQINRIELRNIDALTNPYLTSFLVIGSGFDGVKNKLNIYKEVSNNNYINNSKKDNLPTTLEKALNIYKRSVYLKDKLGNMLYNTILYLKENELIEYNKHVHNYEIKRYL